MEGTVMKELFLVVPQVRYKEGFEKMVEEYKAFGEEEYFDLYKGAISDFKGYVLKLNGDTKEYDGYGWVPTYNFWLTNMNNEILGVVRIRTSLINESVRIFAGHIDYDISPLSRRRGYGTTLLKLALEKAATMFKLDKVLITCDDDNIASKKIIENNGGIFESKILKEENERQRIRYWITLGVPRAILDSQMVFG